MTKKLLLVILFIFPIFNSCTQDNAENGNAVGFVTSVDREGIFWKSWEVRLNVSQTGANNSESYNFSIDNENEPTGLVLLLDSALNNGWKVRITYHKTFGENWFSYRGAHNYFATKCEVLDKNPLKIKQ